MFGKPWREQLQQTVAGLPKSKGSPRVAVVGVGHELRADDAAGLEVARLLNRQSRDDSLIAIEAGPAPENCCGPLFRFCPDLILFVDAANLQSEPGSVRWLAWEDVARTSVSTHTLPLTIVANYLTAELGCPVALIGIQPETISMGAPMSPAVQTAVEETAHSLIDLLSMTHEVTST